MDFGGINYLAVLVAAVAAFVFGAVWYIALTKPWMKAARIDPSQSGVNPAILVMTFVGELILAIGIAGIIGHLGAGQVTLQNGLVGGFFIGLLVVLPVMAVNHRNQLFGWDLTLIDGAHWLGACVIIGAVIGWFGV
jgi:ABC-type spermidine/putrescine transport system permease subunit II